MVMISSPPPQGSSVLSPSSEGIPEDVGDAIADYLEIPRMGETVH